jgi:hypothetical protein
VVEKVIMKCRVTEEVALATGVVAVATVEETDAVVVEVETGEAAAEVEETEEAVAAEEEDKTCNGTIQQFSNSKIIYVISKKIEAQKDAEGPYER